MRKPTSRRRVAVAVAKPDPARARRYRLCNDLIQQPADLMPVGDQEER